MSSSPVGSIRRGAMKWIVGFFVLAHVSVLPAQVAAPVQSTPSAPQISTSATGEARVQPDRATILFAVETRAQTAARAGSENARRQQAVLDTLKKLGLGNGQLSTSGYS